MIKRIFFDLDETLLHTSVNGHPGQDCHVFTFDDDPGITYYTIVRPEATEILAKARELVGDSNVYVLTTSRRDYATLLNELGKLGFPKEQIFTREDLDAHRMATAYGGSATIPSTLLADLNNVLIDNLHPRYNENKCSFIGIQGSGPNYIQVRDYYGVHFPNNDFIHSIMQALYTLNE